MIVPSERPIHPWEETALQGWLPGLHEDLAKLRTPPLHGAIHGDPAPVQIFLPLRPRNEGIGGGESFTSFASDAPRGTAEIATLARALRAGEMTSVELTRACLEKLKVANETLFCVISFCEERALQEAQNADDELARGIDRGALHGIPYGLKDLFAARGARTTFGAEPFKEQTLDFDSAVAEKLNKAGAVLVAKLSLGELAFGDDWFGGKTRTPWNPERGSSGSSAGSA
jgi:hypothetical protein